MGVKHAFERRVLVGVEKLLLTVEQIGPLRFSMKIPTWLEVRSSTSPLPPPIKTIRDELPIDKLRWDDFERLCLRLARTCDEVAECRIYGNPGDEQHGIDLYSSLIGSQKWRVYQCKHVRKVSAKLLASVTDKFLAGTFVKTTEEFVLCTNRSLRATGLEEAWRKEVSKLQARGIRATRWDAEALLSLLREQPRLVFDFFGPAWFENFLGRTPEELATRLTAEQVGLFRQSCRHFYDARVDRLDPGLPLGYREQSVRLRLSERFVSPDVSIRLAPTQKEDRSTSRYEGGETTLPEAQIISGIGPTVRPRPRSQSPSTPASMRLPAQSWIGRTSRQILLGEPGIGKSTILRFLASDLLADEPQWAHTARAWGELLPVWVPFPYWTAQIRARHGYGITLPALLREWLEQEHQKELWPLVNAALEDERLLLLVDGLDEYHDESAAGVALQQLLSFLDAHPASTLMVSRPLGFAPLRGALTNWSIAEVAPLSNVQQDQLASLWFRADAKRYGHGTDEIDAVARRREQDFRQQLRTARELGELASVPLLLGLMVRLHLEGAHLPSSRREACERLANLLLDEHPRRRREAARLAGGAGTSAAQYQIDSRDKRRAFAALALTAFQEKPTGTLTEGDAVRWIANFLGEDEDGICLERSNCYVVAREFLAEARSELGLLVETANRQFGFFHRLIQEWLASERVRELPLSQQQQIVRDRAVHPQWREILLGFFQALPAETLEIFLKDLEAMWQTAPCHQREEIELVLAAAVFGDTQMNGSRRRSLMARSFRLIERHDDVEAREQLLKIALASLAGRSVLPASVVRSRVQGWFPMRQQYRSELLEVIGSWSYDLAALDVLLRNLHDDNIANVRAAAWAVGKMAAGNGDALGSLCGLARSSESPLCRAGALEALRTCLPATDQRLVALARLNRDCGAPDVELVSLGILIPLGEHTTADRRRLLRAGRWLIDPDLEREWHLELARVLAAGWPGDPVVRATAIRSLRSEHSETGRFEHELAFLTLLSGFPNDERATQALVEQLKGKGLGLYFALNRRSQVIAPLAPIWRDNHAFTSAVESWLEENRTLRGYGNLEFYHFAKTGSMKAKLLQHLKDNTTFLGLELHALMDVWGPDDPEVLAGCRRFTNGTPDGYVRANEKLPALVDDAPAARAALMQRLRVEAGLDLPQILRGLRALDGNLASADIVDRCLALRAEDAQTWHQCLEYEMFAHGSPNSQIRELALQPIDDRWSNLDAIAEGWGHDSAFRPRILEDAAGLPSRLRSFVVDALEKLPVTEGWVDSLLARYDSDSDVSVRCAAAAALAHRGTRSESISAETIEGFADNFIGGRPLIPGHRMGGLAGLMAAEQYEKLASVLESGQFQRERTTEYFMPSDAQPLIKSLVQNWDRLSHALNDHQLDLLIGMVDPHRQLLYRPDEIVAGSAFAKWLYQRNESSNDLNPSARRDLQALSVAHPGSHKLRQSCIEVLRGEVGYGPNFEWWNAEHAAQLLAQHFSNEDSVCEELGRSRDPCDWGENTVQALARGWPDSKEFIAWSNWAKQEKVCLRWSTFWAWGFAAFSAKGLIERLQQLDASMNHNSISAFREQSSVLARRLARHADFLVEFAKEITATKSMAVLLTGLSLLKSCGARHDPLQKWLYERSENAARESDPPSRFGTDYTTGVTRNELQIVAAILNRE